MVAMASLREKLIKAIERIPHVQCRPSPVQGGFAIFYRDKEFGHFHSECELDLKLTKNLIKERGLSHPGDSLFHPNRAPGSAWIELRYGNTAEVKEVARLVALAAGVMDRK